MCDDITHIIGLNWMVDGNTLMMVCEGYWGKSCYLNPLLQLWLLVFSDEVVLKYIFYDKIDKGWYDV